MAAQSTSLTAFALTAREGRMREPLDILGAQVLVKLANTDSDGAVAVFDQILPAMSGPPLPRHSREDEWFYVLEGEITAVIDGDQTVLKAGGSALVPRGRAHTIQNFGPEVVQMLVMLIPGEFNQFFEDLSSLNKGLPAPDLVRTERLMKDYGIELLGPPLS